MLQVLGEFTVTFGPIILMMLLPILIPLITLTIGAIVDRIKESSAAKETAVASSASA